MKKSEFERNYNIKVGSLTWQPHYSGQYECAIVGDFVIYRNNDSYEVTQNNSVVRWYYDLGALALR